MTAQDRWIVIPRWDEFQHPDVTRSRVPPWIRNYTRLLSDEAYLNLTGHQRAVLHGLWMEYGRTRCQLTANTVSLTRRLALRVSSRQLEALNHAGFIRIVASKPASLEERRVEKSSEGSSVYLNPKAVTELDQASELELEHDPAGNGTASPNEPEHIAAIIAASLQRAQP